MVNAPESLADLQRDLGRAMSLIEKRRPGYIAGREFYEGDRAELFASPHVEAALRNAAKFAPISLAHIPVDVITDKVELASLTASEKDAADALAIVYDENDLEDESDDWVRKAGYFGDYYVIIDPTEDGEDGDGEPVVTPEGIRLVGSSPLTTVVIYDEKYQRDPVFGAKVWSVGTGERMRTRALLYYDNGTVKLITDFGHPTPDPIDFGFDVPADGEDADAYIGHDGGRMLIEHLAIDGKPYGTPLHKKAWGPQEAITKISATNLSNVDGQGFASRWALADPLAEVDDDIDDDFGTNGPTTDPTKGDGITTATNGTSRVRSIPGAIAILKGIKQVGQFEATSSDDFLKNLDWYVRVMAVATGIPLFEFDLTGEQPSGESRRRAEGRANKKAAKVKRQAGAFFKNLADTVLAVLGTSGTVTATFNPSETSTDKDGLELVALKIANGVPIPQALLEAGYTDEQIAQWYPEGEPHMTPNYLTVLASALQQLGQAKTLGVITDEELADMLPTILTGPRGEAPALDGDIDVEVPVNEVASPESTKAQADALGALVRAGADQAQAAKLVGLGSIDFPNVPTTVRIPEEDAAGLEGTGTAPAA